MQPQFTTRVYEIRECACGCGATFEVPAKNPKKKYLRGHCSRCIFDDPETRFMEHVEKQSNGCWLWTGRLMSNGYAQFTPRHGTGRILAHRYAFEHWKRPLAEKETVDHLCRNRACVNPDHLEAVSLAENIHRGFSPNVVLCRANTCKRGHPLVEPNIQIDRNGTRHCKLCKDAYREARHVDAPITTARRNSLCLRGHPLSGDNLRIDPNGTRHCKACARERSKLRRSTNPIRSRA